MKINVNTATTKELCELKGLGPVLAKRVVAYRKKEPFKRGKDLLNVKGISEDTLKEWKGQLSYTTKKKANKKSTTKTKPKPKSTTKKTRSTKKTSTKTKRKKRSEYKGEPTLKEVLTDLVDNAVTNFIRDKFEDFDNFIEKNTTPKRKKPSHTFARKRALFTETIQKTSSKPPRKRMLKR